MKRFLLLTLLAAGSLTACKKDKEMPAKTKSEQLVNKRWRLSALTGTLTVNGKTQTIDGFAKYPACNKDDFTTYKTDKTYVDDAGATKCSTEPQTETGKWDVNSDQTKLFLTDSQQNNTTFDLTEVSDAKLVVTTVDNSQGTPVTIVGTFTAI